MLEWAPLNRGVLPVPFVCGVLVAGCCLLGGYCGEVGLHCLPVELRAVAVYCRWGASFCTCSGYPLFVVEFQSFVGVEWLLGCCSVRLGRWARRTWRVLFWFFRSF